MYITDENKKLFDKYIKNFNKELNKHRSNACGGCCFQIETARKHNCKLINKFFTDSDDSYHERFQIGCSMAIYNSHNIDYVYTFSLSDQLKKL
jgi:hypothetical protein